MRDAVQLSFRIVMVLMFGLTWSNFTQIYNAASNGLSAHRHKIYSELFAELGQTRY